MSIKFKYQNKGTITQGFEENLNPSYKANGLPGHTGVDSKKGYGSLVEADNAGFVYKVWMPQEREDNWAAVYTIVPHGDIFMEVCVGHMMSIFVEQGDTVLEGQFIGKEGNLGLVYSGNVHITPEMQDAGDKRGSHRHESFRPVKKTKTVKKGFYYLENKNGLYRDTDGYYYEVVYTGPMKGHVNPRQFDYVDTRADRLRCITNALIRIVK